MKDKEIQTLTEDVSSSPYYSADLAPVPPEDRTWSTWNLAAIWIGMAVCIPTYLLASYMIKSGIGWLEALLIIGLSNLIITIPMVLNGHAGVKYGVPFPVIGRSSFGMKGIHIASIVRGLVACGWFGIQTWIGGLAIYAIYNVLAGNEPSYGLTPGQFVGFAIFWVINVYIVWKGVETIKVLEEMAAPILLIMGVILIIWGMRQAGGFGIVLKQSSQLENPTALISNDTETWMLHLNPLKDKTHQEVKAHEFAIFYGNEDPHVVWRPTELNTSIPLNPGTSENIYVQFRKQVDEKWVYSSKVRAAFQDDKAKSKLKIWTYILWLTAMVGFWATMSLSIADITRYAASQKSQVYGQFLGLPGTMMLYSFVGIFVTCAAVINFKDILIGDDAPWDPVHLLARFDHPVIVIISQIFLIIATLSTNIAANVIAPANAFSNLWPKKISFRKGGIITGLIGIIICPWWLLDEISNILIFVSGLLGPVLGIMLSDYFLVRKKEIDLTALYKEDGAYFYFGGFNPAALIALFVGMSLALVGFWIESLDFLYSFSWFTGFGVSFVVYFILMKRYFPTG